MAHAITLDALRVLDEIDRRGSFGAAAAALFRVPSALSYTVQKLESDLEVKLFDRSRQRAQLTAAGRLMLERGRHLLRAANELEEAVLQFESGWEVSLRIAKDTILPLGPLLDQINEFNLLDKQVEIDISEEVLYGTWEALINDRCDLALGATGEPAKGLFDCVTLGEVEFVFAVSPNHPLSLHKGPVDTAAVKAFPTIVAGDSSMVSNGHSSGMLESRQTIRVASLADKIEAQKRGVGVGFLPRHLVANDLLTGALLALPTTIPRPRVPVYMVWRKGTQGKALGWFIQALQQVNWFKPM